MTDTPDIPPPGEGGPGHDEDCPCRECLIPRLMGRLDRYKEALRELADYTGELWYGTKLREGSQAQAVVRHVRGVLGSVLSESGQS